MATKAVRFYYPLMNAEEQRIFDDLYPQIEQHKEHINVQGRLETVQSVVSKMLRDCPEFFYVDTTFMQFSGSRLYTNVHLNYLRDEAESKMLWQRMEQIADRVAHEVQKRNLNNQEAIRYVHDFLVRNVEYDYQSANTGALAGDASAANGALLKRCTCCRGISMGAKMLLDRIGIRSGVLHGRAIMDDAPWILNYTGKGSDVNHAWNIVLVNNDWQHMDVTMDLGITQDKKFGVAYDYFLRSGTCMKFATQYDELQVDDSKEVYSYFMLKKLIIGSEDVLKKCVDYCKKHNVKRIYFQAVGELAKLPSDRVDRIVTKAFRYSYSWRYNDRLGIYDYKKV